MRLPRRVTAALLVSLFPLCLASASLADDGEEAAKFLSKYEQVISETSVSYGSLAGYGFRLNGRPCMNFAELHPYVSFPLTDPIDRTFRGVLEYRVEAVVMDITNMDGGRAVAGISPIGFRYSFTGGRGRFVPYAELTLGMAYLDVPREIEGKRFAFIEGFGVGARYFLGEKAAADLQVRFWHLSNAGIAEPNPGFNTLSFMAGMSFY